MVDPALQIEKQGTDQTRTTAETQNSARRGKRIACEAAYIVSRGTQRHKLADGSQFRIGMGRRRRGVDPELETTPDFLAIASGSDFKKK
jgi:hypothetical protein